MDKCRRSLREYASSPVGDGDLAEFRFNDELVAGLDERGYIAGLEAISKGHVGKGGTLREDSIRGVEQERFRGHVSGHHLIEHPR